MFSQDIAQEVLIIALLFKNECAVCIHSQFQMEPFGKHVNNCETPHENFLLRPSSNRHIAQIVID
jgi:hypothetical protein